MKGIVLFLLSVALIGCAASEDEEADRMTTRVPDMVGMTLKEAEDALYYANSR